MNCDRTMERILEMLDRGQDPAEAPDIRSHVAECADCHGRLDRFLAVEAALSGPVPPPPPGLHRRVIEAVAQERRRNLRVAPDERWWATGAVAASAAAAALTLWFLPELDANTMLIGDLWAPLQDALRTTTTETVASFGGYVPLPDANWENLVPTGTFGWIGAALMGLATVFCNGRAWRQARPGAATETTGKGGVR